VRESSTPNRNIVKRLFCSPDSVQIGLFRNRLESAGIGCEMRNENLSAAVGPGAAFDPEPWVLDDAQFTEASELLAAWRQASAPAVEAD
jgi:hypothetical protein